MIISRSSGFVFVHVPKTAGTSISQFLSKFVHEEDEHLVKDLHKHLSAVEIAAFLGPAEFDQLFSFTVVRNPYDWLLSLYKFLRFDWRNWDGSRKMDQLPRFADFLASDLFRSPRSEAKAPIDSIGRLFNPQSFWICDGGGRIMVDQVVKFERLDADFDAVCTKAGLPLPHKLERNNVGGQRLFARRRSPKRLLQRLQGRADPSRQTLAHAPETLAEAYADPRTRSLVAERYAADFATFGYDPSILPS